MFKASGIMIDDDLTSGESFAKAFNVTRQAVSKKVIGYKNKLGLPDETRDSKRSEARDTYRKANRRNTKI
jgi:predicted transcriptional regulator